jgi:hypothetical protein
MTLARNGANAAKQSTAVVVIKLSMAVKFSEHLPDSLGVVLACLLGLLPPTPRLIFS